MNLPRILIVDDLYGHDLRERRRFCALMRIRDMDGDNPTNSKHDFFAEAKFCSGQVRSKTYVSNSLELVMEEVKKGWPFEDGGRWAMVMIDYQFPSGPLTEDGYVRAMQPGDNQFGKTILAEIAKRWPFRPLFYEEKPDAFPEIPCVMFSTLPSEDVEPEVDPIGNRAFIQRFSEWTQDEIVQRRKEFSEILFVHGLVEDGAFRMADSRGEPQLLIRKRRVVGNSLVTLRTLRNARAAIKKSGYNFVLVQGEKGTGKEEVVRYMHDYSGRGGEFVAFDISAKPSTLIESEIFGYEKGAFTGALPTGAPGVFEQAKTGTAFFDEIGNLELGLLEKLLNVTGFGRYRRVGPYAKERSVECQLICATNKPIREMVRQNLFPPDLEDRFKAVIYLPPLFSREGDKRKLFDYFVEQAVKEDGWRDKIPMQGVYELIESYHWPGNVREMKRLVDLAVSNRRYSGTIQARDIAIAFKSASEMHEPFCKNFESLLNEVRMFRFKSEDVYAARGAYPRFTDAASSLVSDIIETAARLSPRVKSDGSLNCTGCIREVFGGQPNDFKPTKAKRLFMKLSKNYNLDETSDVIKKLIEWADIQDYDGGTEQ